MQLKGRFQVVNQDRLLRDARGAGRFILVGAAIGLMLGAAGYFTQPAMNEATVVVELSKAAPSVDLRKDPRPVKPVKVDTDARLLYSDPVVVAVVQAVERPEQEVRDAIGVSARPTTRVLEITYRDADQAVALTGAQVAAEALLRAREEAILGPGEKYLAAVTAETADPRDMGGATITGDPGALISVLEERRRRALTAQEQFPVAGEVLVESRLTTRSDRGGAAVWLASGAALGALVALLIVISLRRHGDRLSSALASRPAAVGHPTGVRGASSLVLASVGRRATSGVEKARASGGGSAMTRLSGTASAQHANRSAAGGGTAVLDRPGVPPPRPPAPRSPARRDRVAEVSWPELDSVRRLQRQRRRKRLIRLTLLTCLGALVGGALGAVAATRVSTSAVAQTTMVINPQPGNSFDTTLGDISVDLKTEAQLPSSTVVLREVADGDPTFEVVQLRRRTVTNVIDGTQVISVRFRGRTPEEAARMSRLIAEATLAQRAARTSDVHERETAALTELLKDARSQFETFRTSGAEIRYIRVLSARILQLERDLASVQAAKIEPGEIVATSIIASDVGRNRQLAMIAGSALIGALLMFTVGWRRRFARSHGRHRAAARAGVPTAPRGASSGATGGRTGQRGPSEVERLGRAGGLSMAGAVVASLGGILVTAVITNALSKAQAGTVFATTSFFLMAVAVSQLGAEVGVVRFIPASIAHGKASQARSVLVVALLPVLVISSALACAGWLVADDLARVIVRDGNPVQTAEQLQILAVLLPAAATMYVLLAATRGFRTMLPTVVVDSLGRVLLQAGGVAIAFALGLGASAFVVAWSVPYVVALAAAMAWAAFLLRSRAPRVPGQPRDVRGWWPKFWRFTAPRALANVSQIALKRADIVLVAALRSPAEAALYAAASRFVVVGQLGVQALQQALSPQLSAMFARRDVAGAAEVYRTSTAWSVMLSWPVYLTCAVLAPLLLKVFGGGYGSGVPIVVLLCLTMLFATACGAVDAVLLMSGRSVQSLVNNISALTLNLCLNLVLIPRYGALGAAISWAAAIVLRNLLPLFQTYRTHRILPVSKASATVGMAALVIFGVVPAIVGTVTPGFIAQVGAVLVGGLVYLAVVVLLRRQLRLAELFAVLRRRRRAGQKAIPAS